MSGLSLRGLRFAVKEIFDVAGAVTTAGTEVPFGGEPAVRDAPAVERLREAGAVLVGRATSHEFAWGITTRHPRLGGVVNPHDPRRVAGGSSGGSAVAVADGTADVALGTDTGGSTRIPAAFCGVVGWKPPYGAIPLDGVVPLAPTLDHAGVLATSVADAVAVADVAAGEVPKAIPDLPPAELLVGIGHADGFPPPDPAVAAVLAEAYGRLRNIGVTVRDVELPDAAEVRRVHQVIQMTEALALHRRWGLWPRFADRYGDDVRARFIAAESVTAEEADAARLRRTELVGDANRRLDHLDAVLLPVSPCGPSTVDDPDHVVLNGTRIELRDAVMPYTMLANLTGFPAFSVPVGTDKDDMPVGLQLLAVPERTRRLAAVAATVERASGPWASRP